MQKIKFKDFSYNQNTKKWEMAYFLNKEKQNIIDFQTKKECGFFYLGLAFLNNSFDENNSIEKFIEDINLNQRKIQKIIDLGRRFKSVEIILNQFKDQIRQKLNTQLSQFNFEINLNIKINNLNNF